MKTAIVILNWNGQHLLERYLPSVTQHLSEGCELVVADNGSTDDSLNFLSKSYPTVRTIKMDKNYGFAGGYNRALAQIEADYYVLLNDDVEVSAGWVEKITDIMDSDPSIAIAQPKLLMQANHTTFEYAGGAGGYIDRLGYPFCRGRIFNTLEEDHGQYDDPNEIFWASGAAMFVRSSVWHELGGLDEDFFAHMEEIDLCWRAKNKGYKVVCIPQSVVYHLGAGTLPKTSPFKTLLNFRNNLCMLYKNLPQDRVKKVIAMRIVLDWVAAMTFLLKGKVGEFKAVFEAHKQYRKSKPQLTAKRQLIEQQQRHSGMTNKSLLIEYYIRRHKYFSQIIKTR